MSYRITELVWKNSRSAGIDKLVLLAIAYHANDKTAIGWPSLRLLEEHTGLHRATVHRSLKALLEMGELEVVANGKGGRDSVHYRVITADARQPRLMPKGSQRATGRSVRRVADSEGSLRHGAKAPVAPWLHEPVSEPVSEPVKGTGAASGASLQTKMPTARDEVRAQLRLAKELWLEVRTKKHLERFTDSRATRGLLVSVGRALDQSIEWRDIEAGLRVHATDEKANPWYADEWARTAAGDRREAERVAEKMRERAADEEQWAARRSNLHPISDVLRRAN